jgi:signal transduction histidine kinase
MALLLTAIGAFLYVRLRGALDDQINSSLRARADDVAALVRSGSSAGLGDAGPRLAESQESFAQIVGRDGRVADSTSAVRGFPLLTRAEVARARRGTFMVERPAVRRLDNTPVRLLATPVRSRDGTVVVVTGAALDDRADALHALRNQLLVGGPLALLLASLAGYGLATAALRPVEAMRRRADEISAASTGRLPVPRADDEIARLARTLNDMLARLEAGLARERRFVAEASHELRTPLSLLRAELELALRRPRSADELRAAVESAAEETDRLVLLADSLLTLAQADEDALRLHRETLSARDLLDTVAARYALRAQSAGAAIEVDGPDGLVLSGDRLRLEQALGNAVDNALRYGSGPVRLAAAAENGAVELRVTDQGEGFPPDFVPHALERFSRPAGARSPGSAGLGLALVDAIARAHGGSATAANRSAGGAVVVLTLPQPWAKIAAVSG